LLGRDLKLTSDGGEHFSHSECLRHNKPTRNKFSWTESELLGIRNRGQIFGLSGLLNDQSNFGRVSQRCIISPLLTSRYPNKLIHALNSLTDRVLLFEGLSGDVDRLRLHK
jgi:hypothetical protein